jgi:hypothetical protein
MEKQRISSKGPVQIRIWYFPNASLERYPFNAGIDKAKAGTGPSIFAGK